MKRLRTKLMMLWLILKINALYCHSMTDRHTKKLLCRYRIIIKISIIDRKTWKKVYRFVETSI